MHYNYLKDKPYLFKQMVWKCMEDMQEAYPYQWIGLYGFVFFIYFPGGEYAIGGL